MSAQLTAAAAADESLRALMRDVEAGAAALPHACRQDRPPQFSQTHRHGRRRTHAWFRAAVGRRSEAASAPSDFVPNAFLRISSKGSILIYSKGPEIGQGIKTAFPLIIAEELDARWADVVVEQAPVNPAVYGNQSAGGSRSIPSSWDQLRKAGAVARAMLVSAAAASWKVPVEECSTRDSAVWHGKRKLAYGALAVKAAALPVPDAATVKLKERKRLPVVRQGVHRRRQPQGRHRRAAVRHRPAIARTCKFAVYEKCPATGGKVRSANLEEIKKLPGVRDAFVDRRQRQAHRGHGRRRHRGGFHLGRIRSPQETARGMGRIRRVEGQLERVQ